MGSAFSSSRQRQNEPTPQLQPHPPEHENAFHEVVPPFASSSTAVINKVPCDVFINHRGSDVKHKLASTIYHTLDLMGLRSFLDVEVLEPGDVIQTEIQDAMRSASLHIAIFSKNYAQSPWCLAELSFMLKTGTTIFPVFYHVQPTDLRRVDQGTGVYAQAFSQHARKGRYSPEKLHEWKMALQQVSYLDGYLLNDKNDDEGRLLKNIVNSVLKVIKKVPLEVAKHPVGLDEAVLEFESTLQSCESEQNVKIVGIVGMGGFGMGGSGKTTLAKEYYNRKCSAMDRCSFISDVRDAAAKNALHDKQKKLLQDLRVQYSPFDSTEEGKGILARHLRSGCVLVVLDDVDHTDQLDSLLPAMKELGSGSLIIVTSRELGVLTSWGISSTYKMRALDYLHAKQLFCWHAFLKPFPVPGFEDMAEKFLNVCNGLPLSLKVLGGQLYHKSEDYWESQLHKISRILPMDIRKTLKVSYDALDDEEKEIFLDIACFFIGEKKSLAITVWDGSGWSGLVGWETILNKCLVDLDEENCIRMHDHLRDLGREIAIKHSPSRFWSWGQIFNIQRLTEERMLIRGMKAAGLEFPNPSYLFPKRLEKCMELMGNSRFEPLGPSLGLQLLVVSEKEFTKEFATLSGGLVWLRWFDFKYTYFPRWLRWRNLRVLEIDRAEKLEDLWGPPGQFPWQFREIVMANCLEPPLQLRELILSACMKLEQFPSSIGCLKQLKKIVGHFLALRSLPEEFCVLQSLEHLELQHCEMLSSLPTRLGDLTKLRHIDLSYCYKLRTLPISSKQLTRLQYLNLEYCLKFKFTSDNLDILENMTSPGYLNFSRCQQLQELPHQITNQASLRELYLHCVNLRDVPTDIGQLHKLKNLEIGSRLFTSFPTSLGNLSCLTNLSILHCDNLQSLPDSLGNLNLLEYLCINMSGVKSLPSTLKQLANLQTMEIFDCPIRELPLSEGSSSSLYKLKVIHLKATEMSTISISEDGCPSLQILKLERNDYLMEIRTLPTSLQVIEISQCKMLKHMMDFRSLVNLQKLKISGCSQLAELPSCADLTAIQEIIVNGTRCT